MITRVDITPSEFDRRRDRLRSRWADLLESLIAGTDGDVFPVFLRAAENTGVERRRARQSIYAITRHHHIQVKLCSSEMGILVMHCGMVDPSEILKVGVDIDLIFRP